MTLTTELAISLGAVTFSVGVQVVAIAFFFGRTDTRVKNIEGIAREIHSDLKAQKELWRTTAMQHEGRISTLEARVQVPGCSTAGDS